MLFRSYIRDDGSSDGTIDIVRKYLERTNNINLETGEITLLDDEEAFSEKHSIFQTYPVNAYDREELPGWLFSGHSAVVEANEYFFALDFNRGKGKLDTLSLIIMDAHSGEIKSVVSVFKHVYQ